MPRESLSSSQQTLQAQGDVKTEVIQRRLAAERSRRKIQTEMDREVPTIRKTAVQGEGDKLKNSNDSLENSFFNSRENSLFVLILGLTLSIVNDFLDLVLWQKADLISATLDITLLFMFFLLLTLLGRSLLISIGIIFFCFILEIVPVLGVIPFWTIGILLWFFLSKKK